MLDSNSLYVKDDNGQEKRMVILFTFDAPDERQYVVFQDPEGDEDELFAAVYNDAGELFAIENDADLEMVQEVINTFLEDEEEVDE